MHELSIAQALISLATKEAAQAEARKVEAITVEIGALSGVVPDALSFCFPMAARDTVLQGAELRLEHVAGVGYCAGCREEFPMPELLTLCPGCSGFASDIRAGQELRLKSLEVV